MTGTSLDGLDAALVRVVGTGLEMSAQYLGGVSHPMPPELKATLLHLASGGTAEPLTYLRAARAIGELYADGVQRLLDETHGPKPQFVVAHGQTIWHAPHDPRPRNIRKPRASPTPRGVGGTAHPAATEPKSWQLFDPWPIVRRLGTAVCYDLRQADLIAGGEGAPLTPLADQVIYRGKADLVANLGGVFNYTACLQGPGQGMTGIRGGDVCLCNLLLDSLAQRLIGQSFDHHGEVASAGTFDEGLVRAYAQHFPVLGLGQGTLGREDLGGHALDRVLAAHQGRSASDLLFNAAALIASAVSEVLKDTAATRLVLAGGGARNKTLVRHIRDHAAQAGLTQDIALSDDLGIPCEAREAMGFAVLGALSQDGVPVSLPQVTGSQNPGVAGVWAGL